MNSLTITNAQLQYQKERPAKRVTYNPVTGLTDQVPAMPLDSALSSSSTNPVQNRVISEAVIDLTNKASHNAAGIEHNASDISLLNERTNNNAIAIQHNANDITELDTKTDTLAATVANVSEDMETVNTNMSALDDKVDTFSDAIEQNTRDIQKNKRDIQQNANEIARVEGEISDVSEILVTVREHTVEIAALDDKVNTNTANIATNATAISDEVTRATAAENTNATAISDEVTRATAAESTNATAISDEVTRATGAEGALQTAIGNIPVVSANVTDTATETLSNIKVGSTVYGMGGSSFEYITTDFNESYGSSNTTKYTSYKALSAGTWLCFVAVGRGSTGTVNGNLKITIPNIRGASNPCINLNLGSLTSNMVQQPAQVINLSSSTSHRLTVATSDVSMYTVGNIKVNVTYIKLG